MLIQECWILSVMLIPIMKIRYTMKISEITLSRFNYYILSC